ncbi:MAG TPA: hypothetical protein VJL58_11490, partial [Pyrinomonadaceae bacterium]|nr:hypothetical protein [Pyrinomonadaceae bacterium]
MKRCSKCHRTYTDETLNFCLDDGEWLSAESDSDEPATAILASEAPTRVHSAPETSSSDKGEKLTSSARGRYLVLGVIGVVFIAAVGIGAYWLYGTRTSSQIDSVAVLPFENATGDPGMDYLSEGLSESLIDKLSELPQLTVIARYSSFKYRGADVDLQDVADKLHVRAIVTG